MKNIIKYENNIIFNIFKFLKNENKIVRYWDYQIYIVNTLFIIIFIFYERIINTINLAINYLGWEYFNGIN